ncbi:MAG: NmrA family NAD(P)-binding protein [Caulobacter sp.]|nr:NmrA family NAD(P)-binding protein [Caulobacter sp.]
MILVIGGTGRIGSALVRRLKQTGVPVRAMVRDPVAAATKPGFDVETVAGDLDAPGSLDAALAGATSLFLLTTQSPRQREQELAAITAAGRAGVRYVVKVSASDAATGPDSPTPVGRAHAAAEAALKTSGMAWTILRPSAFMPVVLGPLFQQAGARGGFQLPLGSGRVAFVDVEDIARAAAWALTHPAEAAGRTLSVTGPESLGINDIADRFAAALGRPVKASSPPAFLARLVLGRRIADPFLRRHQLAMLDLMRSGGMSRVSPDLENATGEPGRSVADWLAAAAARPANGETSA